jgi:hypothetical protein
MRHPAARRLAPAPSVSSPARPRRKLRRVERRDIATPPIEGYS